MDEYADWETGQEQPRIMRCLQEEGDVDDALLSDLQRAREYLGQIVTPTAQGFVSRESADALLERAIERVKGKGRD